MTIRVSLVSIGSIAGTAAFLSYGLSAQQTDLVSPGETTVAEALPEHLAYMYVGQGGGPEGASSQLSTTTFRWRPGDRLKVCFYGGNPVANALVAKTAIEWNRYSSVQFDFGTPPRYRDCTNAQEGFSQIKVGYGSAGYWSAIGTSSSTYLNNSQPSMNFQRFDLQYSSFQRTADGRALTADNVDHLADPYHRGTILHEFGHALGLLHEHQNPSLNCYDEIRWTGANNAYDYYGGSPNFWGRDKVDYNVGRLRLRPTEYDPGAPDRSSIMMYAQPAAIFIRGTGSPCFGPPNNALSVLDKQYIATIYPGAAAPSSDHQELAAPLPAIAPVVAATASGQNDLLTRVNVDLISGDTTTRREARNQLAALLQSTGDADLASRLLGDAYKKSYRRMLGVTTAIGRTNLSFSKTPTIQRAAITALDALDRDNADRIKDPSLTQSIQSARVVISR